MRTVEVPQNDWSRTLNQFSARHEGWLISLDLKDEKFGARREIQNLPLLGVTAEPAVRAKDITIAAARSGEDHVTHTIQSPTRIGLERTDDGSDVGLEIEAADGTVAILRFRTVALPETLNGIRR
jgi:Family of unknown function (DUF5335)